MKINKHIIFTIFLVLAFVASVYGNRRSPTVISPEDAMTYALTEDQNNEKVKAKGVEDEEREDPGSKNLENNVFYADEWIKSWFIRIDQNGDKKINRKEFEENMKIFSIENKHLSAFENPEVNPDGVLNLLEFQRLIDSTNFLTREEVAQSAATVADETNEVDTIKLMAGVLAISLLMAAFKFV